MERRFDVRSFFVDWRLSNRLCWYGACAMMPLVVIQEELDECREGESAGTGEESY